LIILLFNKVTPQCPEVEDAVALEEDVVALKVVVVERSSSRKKRDSRRRISTMRSMIVRSDSFLLIFCLIINILSLQSPPLEIKWSSINDKKMMVIFVMHYLVNEVAYNLFPFIILMDK
jgi:hypothetical protein